MSKLKNKIRTAAKNDIADFDAWYEKNKTTIANKQIFAAQSTPVSAKKPFRLRPLASACALVAVVVCIVLTLTLLPTVNNNEPSDVVVGENPGEKEVVIEEQDFTAEIVSLYFSLIGKMDFKVGIDNLTAIKTGDAVTAFKGEVKKSDSVSYSVNVKVSNESDYDFDDKFSTDTAVHYTAIDNYDIWYQKDDTADTYMLKLSKYGVDVDCYMLVQTLADEQVDIVGFIEKLCRG